MVSCNSGGSFVVRKSIEKNTLTTMSMSYEKFDGYKYRNIKVTEPITITISFTTKSGTLNAYIAKDDDKNNAIFNQSNIQTSENISVEITQSGTYTIKVIGENHSGSYKFVWE